MGATFARKRGRRQVAAPRDPEPGRSSCVQAGGRIIRSFLRNLGVGLRFLGGSKMNSAVSLAHPLGAVSRLACSPAFARRRRQCHSRAPAARPWRPRSPRQNADVSRSAIAAIGATIAIVADDMAVASFDTTITTTTGVIAAIIAVCSPASRIPDSISALAYQTTVIMPSRADTIAAAGNSAHVAWCYDRYRSYRAWDNTFQPYNGPRRQCWSPYS